MQKKIILVGVIYSEKGVGGVNILWCRWLKSPRLFLGEGFLDLLTVIFYLDDFLGTKIPLFIFDFEIINSRR